MQVSQDVIENSIKYTVEKLRPIVTSTKGQKENVLKLDGGILIDIIACKILIPIFVSLTSTVFIKKIFPDKAKDKSIEELKEELNACVGLPVGTIDEAKKKEVTEMVRTQINRFGGTEEQAKELVGSILQVIQKSEKK
jgi:hypothetical protein